MHRNKGLFNLKLTLFLIKKREGEREWEVEIYRQNFDYIWKKLYKLFILFVNKLQNWSKMPWQIFISYNQILCRVFFLSHLMLSAKYIYITQSIFTFISPIKNNFGMLIMMDGFWGMIEQRKTLNLTSSRDRQWKWKCGKRAKRKSR